MMKKRVEFKVEGQKLIGTICLPEGKGPFPGIVFYHGMVSDRKGYILLCQKLAKIGIVGFCFDFRGCGESEGEFEQSNLRNRLEDAQAAFDFLASQPFVDKDRIGILGSSMGGHIASVIASKNKGVRSLVLRAPGAYADKLRGIDISQAVRVEKTPGEIEKKSEAIKAIKTFKGSLLIIESEFDKIIPHETIKAYFNNAVLAREKKIHIIRGSTHSLPEDSSYKKEFRRLSIDWFQRTLVL